MSADIPIPPVDLSARLMLSTRSRAESEAYAERGRNSLRAIERVLPDDWDWHGKAVLDFGCGAGRVLRHLVPRGSEVELWGSDIDPRCIEWCTRHLSPPASFVLNGEAPPLPLPDEKFDLVYAFSVFTHINDLWAAWLLELERVIAPGGRLVASFMGPGMYEAVAGERLEESQVGMNVYEAGQDWRLGGPMVIHSPWWIEEHWGRLFEVEHLRPQSFIDAPPKIWQDDHGVAVLRKRQEPRPSVEELERLDPAEPREAIALRHDVLHLRAEVAALRGLAPKPLPRRSWRDRAVGALAGLRRRLARRRR